MQKFSFIFNRLIYLILISYLLANLCACSKSSMELTKSSTNTEHITTLTDVDYDNLESLVDFDNAVPINLEDTSQAIEGVTTNDSVFTIVRSGTYVISGNLSDGQLKVDADKQDVWLVLDGAHISCHSSAPIYIADAKNTYIVLKTESNNSITDGTNYEVDSDGDPDATLFCKNDLIIGGGGNLSISSNYNNALHTKDTLNICGGNIEINSVDTGIKAKDGITISSGVLNITSEGDSIQTTNSEDTSLGSIMISGGDITAKSQKDAIQAENELSISGGEFSLTTGEGAKSTYSQMDFWNSDVDSDVSMKAIKSGGVLCIEGGTFSINSEDDALHSNSNVTINGGVFSIKSGDDGVHADDILTINSGSIDITQSYEGIEGSEIHLNGGDTHIKANDDGVNSAGGGDSSYGGFGPDSFGNSSYILEINSGYLYIDSEGDGMDSNGSITITGGTTVINGPTNNGNSPFDWETECTVSGGTLIAAGSSGMMESVSQSSTQQSIAIYFSSTNNAETICNIASDDDNFSLSFAPSKSYSYFFISTPELKENANYTISLGGTANGESTDGLTSSGEYSGGEVYTQISTDSIVTMSGSSFGGMGGGMYGPGGMQKPGGGFGR